MDELFDTREYIKDLGKAIARKRIEKGLSQAQLAEITNILFNTIGNIERGQRIGKINNIMVLCLYFDVSIDAVLFNRKRYSTKYLPTKSRPNWPSYLMMQKILSSNCINY